ncbi:hypothetical protein MKW92_028814 [Papaver armeniacum]|nr:hypothetical protein MKW92_028814 [Papaver armeniacum]
MGNALRFLFRKCFKPIDHQEYDLLGHHGLSIATVGVSVLAHDHQEYQLKLKLHGSYYFYPTTCLIEIMKTPFFEIVFVKLVQAWKEANPPPKTPEQASRLVTQTLEMADDVEIGLLKFYGLPIPHDRVEVRSLVVFPPPPPPEQVKYIVCLVDARNVSDGDCLMVYVDIADTREASDVPMVVQIAISERLKARAFKDYAKVDALYKMIVDAGYRLLRGANNADILAKKYRIRLRGIDSPKNKMHYGKEAKEELTNLVQGQCLTIGVYGEDKYGRLVGDEVMLKKGCAWQNASFGSRPELRKWEMEARAARLGLWAMSNREKPWEWRKNNPAMSWDWRIRIITKRTC